MSHVSYQSPFIPFLIPKHESFLCKVLALLQYEEQPTPYCAYGSLKILFMVHGEEVSDFCKHE